MLLMCCCSVRGKCVCVCSMRVLCAMCVCECECECVRVFRHVMAKVLLLKVARNEAKTAHGRR